MSWRIKGSGTGEPSLDLRFAATKSLNDYVSGNNLTTFTRSSTGTYFDANGVLQSAPAGVARFDHNPETGESLGLLMEEARTNLLLNSATLSTQSATVTATSTTLSFYGTGTVTLTGVSTAGPLVGTGASNRVSLTFTPTAGSLTLTVSGSVTNAQLEAGSYPTSYIPTAGSTVTRAADVCTLTNSNIYDTDSFTIINQPFGASAGASTLTLFDGLEPIKRATVYSADLSQATINAAAGKTDEFWRWRVLGSSFALPNFATDGQVTVDWGDGTIETLTTAEHTFSNGGGYHDIGFRLDSGTYFRPYINNNASHDTKVVALGPAPESMKLNAQNAFYGCSNLEAFDATVDATGGTNFDGAWRGCTSLTSFPLIDTAAGTDFSRAWLDCISLTSFPPINTAAGTNFQNAWYNCTSLTSFPLINTAAGTNFSYAWRLCSSLTSFPEINTAAGTNFQSTWQNCTSLTSFPEINTAAGTNFRETWRTCNSLTSFPSIDTSSGTDFRSAWNSCNSLTSFPLIDTSSGTAFGSAWSGCAGLTSFPLLNTSAGTNFDTAWSGCSGLTSFPLINIAAGTSFYRAWYNCSSLTDFPANFFDSWSGTPANECFHDTWDNCSSLTPASVVNILDSIAASGQSAPSGTSGGDKEITIDWDGTGDPATDAAAAITTLKSRNWQIRLNGVLQ